ncbi:MAG: methyltransferase domain-containing protein [Bacteroidota bacterium]
MVEIRHFLLVEAIERLGSLKKAAQELHLTPSALSHQLKQLEQSLDTPIFHRVNNQLHFTALGKEFCETAKEILGKMQDIETRIEENKQRPIDDYIHGYSEVETQRLYDQANSIADFLHWDSKWAAGSTILEAGCGVGAQTKIIAAQNKDCQFISVDISTKSLAVARQLATDLELANVVFLEEDLTQLTFQDETFDHVFLCFVLEHVKKPLQILQELQRVLKPNGTITVIEGDHGSTYFYPDSVAARKAVQAQVTLQQQKGGDPNIGRSLYPLLEQAGFQKINVTPRQIYVDDSKPALVQGFTRDTFTAMIKGIAEEAIGQKVISEVEFWEGIQDLEKTASGGGTFCYTFFKGVAKKVLRMK